LAACHRRPGDTSDVGGRLRALSADADGIGIAGRAQRTDLDIVATSGGVLSSLEADRDVVAAGGVVAESARSGGGVIEACGVVQQAVIPARRVVQAGRVAEEGLPASEPGALSLIPF
jgi:hypothetical protein